MSSRARSSSAAPSRVVVAVPGQALLGRSRAEHRVEKRRNGEDDQPDEEFVFHLLGALYQVAYMHKGSPFNPVQTNLLRRIVQRIAGKAVEQGFFEYFGEDIKNSADRVLAEMGRHHS